MDVARARPFGQVRDVEQDRLERVEERGGRLVAARFGVAPERDVLVQELARLLFFVRDVERAIERRGPHVSKRAEQQPRLLGVARYFKIEIPGHRGRGRARGRHRWATLRHDLLETRCVRGKRWSGWPGRRLPFIE